MPSPPRLACSGLASLTCPFPPPSVRLTRHRARGRGGVADHAVHRGAQGVVRNCGQVEQHRAPQKLPPPAARTLGDGVTPAARAQRSATCGHQRAVHEPSHVVPVAACGLQTCFKMRDSDLFQDAPGRPCVAPWMQHVAPCSWAVPHRNRGHAGKARATASQATHRELVPERRKIHEHP